MAGHTRTALLLARSSAHRVIVSGGSEAFFHGTENHCGNGSHVSVQREGFGKTEPFQAMPFPVAQLGRASVEQFRRPIQIVGGQFALGQGDAVVVKLNL